MRVAIAIAAKELRQRIRDRSAIFIAFIAPTLIAAIISAAFGTNFGPNAAGIHFSAVIADADHSPLSQTFAGILHSSQLENLVRPIHSVATPDEALSTLDAHHADVAFVVPQGFQAAVTSGARANLTVVGRADLTIYRDIAQAIATSFTEQISADRLSVVTTIRTGSHPADIATLASKAAQQQIPISLTDEGLANHPVSGANYFGPGMAMFFLFFTVGAGARSLFAEREQGTLQQLLAAPTGRSWVVLG